jgi:acyl-CoA reductase-like NAD-dependent aldehyde dehydrogenase
VVAEQNADIDRRMVTALQTLNPTKAAELQAKLTEVERARELASVTDAATRARLQELYAMQDAAAASAQLTQSLRDQAEAAQKAADFTATVRDDFLRATGNTLAAEKEKLTKERDDRLKTAQELGLASDIVDQINATYQTKLQKLMNDSQGGLIPGIPAGSSNSASNTMPPGTSVGSVALSTIPGVVPERTDAGTVLGGDTVTFRGGNSITETSGMRLIDYAASQLAVLREIRDAVVAGGPAATDLLPSLARQLDRTYGRTTSDQLRSVFGEVA